MEQPERVISEGLNIICDPRLVEGVVRLMMRLREQTGDMSISDDYYREADAIYNKYPLEERSNRAFDEEFESLNYRFFIRCGLLDLIKRVLDEYPIISEEVGEIVIKKAYIREKSEANLVDRRIIDDKKGELKVVNISLSEDLFEDLSYLEKFLRWEVMHVVDMLDKSFGYEDTKFGESPAEEFIVRQRYGVMWNMYINSRLIRMGRETPFDKDLCRLEFYRCYAGLSAKEMFGCFEGLWQADRLTHRQIVEMVGDVERLLSISTAVKDETAVEAGKAKRVHLSGSLCPICRFPTYHWVDAEDIDKNIMELILKDLKGLSSWNPEDGACERCVEVYKLKAGKW